MAVVNLRPTIRTVSPTAQTKTAYETVTTIATEAPFAYTHDQPTPATVWTIDHNLNGYPNVTAVDTGGARIVGTVDYVTANRVTITHATPYAGAAYLS